MKIVLIQLWLGKIPDYFWYHYETTKNLNLNFLFVTDQEIILNSKNYTVIKKTKTEIEEIFNQKNNTNITIQKNRNVVILKAALGDMFSEYIEDYDYFGFYDIDTILGDLKFLSLEENSKYDVISFGNKNFYERISGVLTIIKNNNFNKTLYKQKINSLLEKIQNYNIDSFEEHELNQLVNENLKVKIFYNICNSSKTNGKDSFNFVWSGGKLLIDGHQKNIFHFYHKNEITLNKIGNTIIGEHKKKLIDDFYWITYFTENYEKNAIGLFESIKKYSNRRCVIYTINYDSNLKYQYGEQFIFRRLDIDKGDTDKQGRDISVLSSKPIVLKDSVNFIPEGNFIYIDTDVYMTTVCDDLCAFFKGLEKYPLMNSHIHDRLYANDINPSREWVSTIDILSEETKIPVVVFPRRKANVIIYNKNSEWFFDEQMEIYEKHKNKRPGIFRLHDEDSANILLSKYNFQNSLPLIDMEESTNLNFEKIKNYSYNISLISEHVKLPKNENEIYLFHGFKDINFYKKIDEDYGSTVLECDDIIITYVDRTVLFKRNNLLTNKNIKKVVSFFVKDKNNNIVLSLSNQKLYDFWLFYISDVDLCDDFYYVEIVEDETNKIIYKNVLNIN